MSIIVEIDNNVTDVKEMERSKSSTSKKKSTKIYNTESENLSITDLDLIANKRKLAKKNTELSVSDFTKKSSQSRKSSKSTVVEEPRKSYKRSAVLENDDPQIRREKSDYLYKFNKLNVDNKFSSCKFDMNTPLSEIRNEYDRIKNSLENERSVKFLQRMMLLMIQGVEMMNTKFDPLGIDLDGWGESMAYSLETREYDEVLSELYEKYKGVGNMSPELKLVFMVISSASMFAITKRLTKNEGNLGSLISNLMGNSPKKVEMTATETTVDDELPSKLNEPEAEISINDILEKMNRQRQVPQNTVNKTIDEDVLLDVDLDQKTEDVLRNIQITAQPKKRGRPGKAKKQNINISA
jgi:hypothetical protein